MLDLKQAEELGASLALLTGDNDAHSTAVKVTSGNWTNVA